MSIPPRLLYTEPAANSIFGGVNARSPDHGQAECTSRLWSLFIRTILVSRLVHLSRFESREHFSHVSVQPPLRTITMPELIEEQESAQPDFDRYARPGPSPAHVLPRARYFWAGSSSGEAAGYCRRSYKSSTLILVEQPTMPQSYVAPNVNENLQDRLQSITQQILSRTRLLMIIDKLNLYADAKRLKTPGRQGRGVAQRHQRRSRAGHAVTRRSPLSG